MAPAPSSSGGRSRQHEAAVVLARTSIDAAITGLYCIRTPEAAEQFKAQTGKAFNVILGDATEGNLEFDLQSFLIAEFGTQSIPVPLKMADRLDDSGVSANARDLYRRYYFPLSAAYLHAGPIALLRHVDPRTGRPRMEARHLWSARSAAHTADAMVAALARELVGEGHPDYELFRTYGEDHWRMVVASLLFLLRTLVRRLRRKYLPRLVLTLRRAKRAMDDRGLLPDRELDDLATALSDFLGVTPGDSAVERLLALWRESFSKQPS